MADDAEVRGCKWRKGTIVKAIQEHGPSRRRCALAHQGIESCGLCTGLVEQILMATAAAPTSHAEEQAAAYRDRLTS